MSTRRLPAWTRDVLAWVTGLTVFVGLFHRLLVSGSSTLIHDNVFWIYPIYQFFAGSLAEGVYPLWNPFSHGGEPFYPLLFQSKLLDPFASLVAFVGGRLTDNLVLLFNWHEMLTVVVQALGIYLLLARCARPRWIRFALIPPLLLSSFVIAPMRQDGFSCLFGWTPYWLLLVLKILENSGAASWSVWLGAAALFGASMQSYFFAGPSVYLLLFLAGVLMFRREMMWGIIREQGVWRKVAGFFLLLAAMAAPNVVLLSESGRFVYPARMFDGTPSPGKPMGKPQQYEGKTLIQEDRVRMPYAVVENTGTFSALSDFVQLIAPEGNRYVKWPGGIPWGRSSEAFMYLGLLPWFIALVGMIWGKDPMKRVWLTSTMGVALLMIGPNGFLHRLLFEVFPPMWFMRHTSALVLYFLMGVLYFFVLGCNELVARWKGEGVAGTAMKEDSANGPSWLRYSVLMFFGFVIWPLCSEMILSELQERRFVPHWLGLLFFGGFGIWRYLGRGWFFASLVVGQIAAVLVHSFTPLLFLVRLILMGVLPAAVFALAFRYFPRERRTRNAVTIPVCTLILVAGCGDLVFSHYRMTWMYRMDRLIQLGPRATVQATPLSYTDFRAISPNREDVSWDEVRYRSLLERKPYAFASVVKQANANSWAVGAEQQTLMARPGDEFEMARQVLRINSLFLLRNYFRLVNSPVPSPVLKEIFAIDRPLFRFSPGGPFLDEETYIKESQAASVVARLKSVEDLAAGARAGESLDRSDSTLWAVFLEQHSGSGPEEDSRNVFDYVVERFTSNGIVLAVKSMHAGLLYWADGYDPSWRASVDGKPVEILRAHMNFKAISIPAGTSRVQFAYEPRMFEAALGLFNLAALIPALVWGAERAGGHRPVRAEG